MISRQLKTNSESQNVLARCEETHLILEGNKKKTLSVRFRLQRGGWLQKRLDAQIWKPITQNQGSDWEEMEIGNMELNTWINAFPNLSDQVTLNPSRKVPIFPVKGLYSSLVFRSHRSLKQARQYISLLGNLHPSIPWATRPKTRVKSQHNLAKEVLSLLGRKGITPPRCFRNCVSAEIRPFWNQRKEITNLDK